MKNTPPFEKSVNYYHYGISEKRAHVLDYAVPSDDSPDGLQILPIGHYQPENQRLADDTVVIRGFAWSAANKPAYQRARTQFWADAYGIHTLAPNTVGQGEGSPDLNDRQKDQLSRGNTSDIGRVMLGAAFRSYEETGRKISRVVLLGESQFPTLLPGIVEQLPEGIDLSHIVIYNPAGTEEIRPSALLWPKLKKASKFFDIYRGRNPVELQRMKDTNILKSLITQFPAHTWYYRKILANGEMAKKLKKQLDERGFKPEIHLISAEFDLCSAQANQEAAKILGARYSVKKGHDHAYTEYVPVVAKELADILK